MTDAEGPFRALNDFERSVIERLLEAPFSGRDQIREQVATALVRP